MSIDEPTAIGTVAVSPCKHGIAVLCETCETKEVFGWRALMPDGNWTWASWWELDGWVVVHEGYRPPTPEPTGEGAVVRYRYDDDCCWCVVHAIDDPDLDYRTWHHTDGSGKGRRWSELPNDIEVLFEGVTE